MWWRQRSICSRRADNGSRLRHTPLWSSQARAASLRPLGAGMARPVYGQIQCVRSAVITWNSGSPASRSSTGTGRSPWPMNGAGVGGGWGRALRSRRIQLVVRPGSWAGGCAGRPLRWRVVVRRGSSIVFPVRGGPRILDARVGRQPPSGNGGFRCRSRQPLLSVAGQGLMAFGCGSAAHFRQLMQGLGYISDSSL